MPRNWDHDPEDAVVRRLLLVGEGEAQHRRVDQIGAERQRDMIAHLCTGHTKHRAARQGEGRQVSARSRRPRHSRTMHRGLQSVVEQRDEDPAVALEEEEEQDAETDRPGGARHGQVPMVKPHGALAGVREKGVAP